MYLDERDFRIELEKKTDTELRDYLDDLCQKIYAAEYYEIFDFEQLTRDDMIYKCIYLKKKYDIIAHDGNKGSKERNFLDIWRDWWDIRIGHQEDIRDMYAFVGLSQVIKGVQIPRGVDDDLRIHFAVIAPPATGKSEANDFIAEFGELCKLKIYVASPSWLSKPNPSVFEVNDIVIFDEGKSVLKATDRVITLLLATMNRQSSKGNRLNITTNDDSEKFEPKSSIVVTTYPPDDIHKHFRNGLLQRIITYFQTEDPIRRTEITKHIVSSIPTFKDDVDEARKKNEMRNRSIEILKKEMITEVKKLREFHANSDYIYMRSGADTLIDHYIDELRNIVPNMTNEQQTLWNEMMSRLTINLIKISALYALMNYRTYIIHDDVHNAARVMFPIARSVAMFITRGMKMSTSNDKYNRLQELLKKDWLGYKFTVDGWLKILNTQYNISQQSARAILDMMVETGKMRSYTNKLTQEKLLMLN